MEEKGTYTYQYPHPAVTTDCVIFGFDGKELRVLLVERGQEPCKGMLAFPGGFLQIDETLEECARRELKEETSLEAEKIEQFRAFSAVNRDPRERVISVAFFGLVKMAAVCGGDDARSAQWVRIDEVPQLAFDHDYIFREATRYLRKKIYFEPIGFDLLDETFTFPQLQRLYEAILGVQFDRRNFKRKMIQLGLIESAEEDEIVEALPKRTVSLSKIERLYLSTIDKVFDADLCCKEPPSEYVPKSCGAPPTPSFSFEKSENGTSHEVGRKPKWFKFNKKRYEELKENPENFRIEF